RGRYQTQIAGRRTIDPQQQMPRTLVQAIQIGIGRGLLNDKDALPKAQDLIEHVYRELLEALPFHGDIWHGAQRRSSSSRAPCSRAITVRSPTSLSTSGQSLNGPAAPASRSGSSPISNSFRSPGALLLFPAHRSAMRLRCAPGRSATTATGSA